MSMVRVLVGLIPLCGCNLVLPFGAGTEQSEGGQDLSSDVTSDVIDAAADSRTDLHPPEELGTDTSPSGACIPPAVELPWPDTARIVLCRLPAATTTNQCEAAQHCNEGTGWHMCTASDYLQYSGGDAPPDDGRYWLASCIRQDDAVFAPEESICSGGCTATERSLLDVAWHCPPLSPSAVSVRFEPLGVTTYLSCRRLGQNSSNWQASWWYARTDARLAGATCCR